VPQRNRRGVIERERAMTSMTGGCQCGRVRYTADVEPDQAYLCHCNMCKRATGGVSIAYVNPPKDKVVWHSEPDWYRSSPIAHRPFCSRCGTPLGFDFLEGGANIGRHGTMRWKACWKPGPMCGICPA
jgi:hypothetical protein